MALPGIFLECPAPILWVIRRTGEAEARYLRVATRTETKGGAQLLSWVAGSRKAGAWSTRDGAERVRLADGDAAAHSRAVRLENDEARAWGCE